MVTLGVDLGTCYSSVGFRDTQGMTYVKDNAAAGLSYSIPSSVLVRDDGSLVFGARAEQEKNRRPERYQAQFKRDLGSGVPYQLGELTISPDELTARFLQFLVAEARRATPAEVTGAVITVPAAYDTARREVIRRAALAAGLNSITTVEEPVAAIMMAAAGGQVPGEGTFLVYDLGGGTFDAAVVRIGGGRHQVLGARGLADFGGTDVDLLIERDLARVAGDELLDLLDGADSQDPLKRSRALKARIAARDLCREIKHRLSTSEHAEGDLFLSITYELDRAALEDMVRPSLDRTVDACRQLVADVEVAWPDIDGVLLVGGACRMPCVGAVVETALDRKLLRAADPELVVCAGAALLAHPEIPPIPPQQPTPPDPPIAPPVPDPPAILELLALAGTVGATASRANALAERLQPSEKPITGMRCAYGTVRDLTLLVVTSRGIRWVTEKGPNLEHGFVAAADIKSVQSKNDLVLIGRDGARYRFTSFRTAQLASAVAAARALVG